VNLFDESVKQFCKVSHFLSTLWQILCIIFLMILIRRSDSDCMPRMRRDKTEQINKK